MSRRGDCSLLRAWTSVSTAPCVIGVWITVRKSSKTWPNTLSSLQICMTVNGKLPQRTVVNGPKLLREQSKGPREKDK